MKRTTLLMISACLLSGAVSFVPAHHAYAQLQVAQAAPDNTGRNVRDSEGSTLTPMDQSENEADVTLTQQIRKAVMEDDTLSMTAKNIKIITVNGVVTLRGPVDNEQERNRIVAKAEQLAGAKKVDSQLEVKK
jgi:hyperosmotically inducible protein